MFGKCTKKSLKKIDILKIGKKTIHYERKQLNDVLENVKSIILLDLQD